MKRKKNILITNDDGYKAKGLKSLVKALKPIANIKVVAPMKNKSACSHSMSLTNHLRFKKIKKDFYYLEDGTPTDCIFLSLSTFYKDKLPDLVISGINIGSNMGEDTTYSGTVAGAMEGVLQGVPSIAISQVFDNLEKNRLVKNWDYALANKVIIKIVKKIFKGKFPLEKRKLLNINIPQTSIKKCKGIKITNAGFRVFGNSSHRYKDPKGGTFHWIGTHPLLWEKQPNKFCDFEAIKTNYVSITPIKLDLTSYDDIEKLNKWLDLS
jgi:5'-nucleotidase